MNNLPQMPDSAVVACDGSEVYLSFHFHTDSFEDALNLQRPLTFWLQLFLEMQGAVAVEIDMDTYNG